MQKESQSGVYATRALVKVPIVDAFSHPGCPSLGTASKRFAGGIRFPSNCTLQFEFMQHVLFRWTQHSASLADGTNLSPGDGANLSPGMAPTSTSYVGMLTRITAHSLNMGPSRTQEWRVFLGKGPPLFVFLLWGKLFLAQTRLF